MSDHDITIQLSNQDRGRSWLSRKFSEYAQSLAEKKEAERVLSENELALRRMSDIATKVVELADSPAFKEKAKKSRQTVGQSSWDDYHVYIPQTSDGLSYGITIDKEENSDKIIGISVFVSPSDHENYTTRRGDGHFRIQIQPDDSKDVKREKKDTGPNYQWGDSVITGDLFLGKETSEDIQEIGVSYLSTSVHLKSVSFGGWPSISLILRATAKDKLGKYLGPISKINSLQVIGVARARHPVTDHISDSESETIPITNDFDRIGHPFIFDRGKANFHAAKTVIKGREVLAFRFSGIRKRLNPADRDMPIVDDPEHKDVAVPTDLASGFKVIDLIEKALDETIGACKQSTPQLRDKNS